MFPCVSSYRWIHFPRSVLSFLSTTPVAVHSFLRKKKFFHIHEITRVDVLYTSLRLVEGVYKPQRACVGWASVTESCLEVCMCIKRTSLDEFPPGHPKMFERTLHIISLFVLAISNNINLFPSFFYAVPHENVRKMKLFHTDCPDFKKIDKNNLYVTCTQNWEVPVSYKWCHTETRESARENSVSNTVWESPLLKSL